MSYTYKYPHPNVTTDCVIFGYDGKCLSVLLIQRGNEPYKGSWAFPGGFLNIDELADDGAKRELLEETGLETANVRQFYTFSDPLRDPRERIISIAYYALVPIQKVKGADDAAEARWFPIQQLPTLAFDHHEVLAMALQALRRQLFFEPVGRDVLPDIFTIEELQQLYSVILDNDDAASHLCRNCIKQQIVIPVKTETATSAEEVTVRYRFSEETSNRTIPYGYL